MEGRWAGRDIDGRSTAASAAARLAGGSRRGRRRGRRGAARLAGGRAAPIAAAAPPVAAAAARTSRPISTAFRAWLATEPGLPLDRAGARARAARTAPRPRRLMLLTDMPVAEDAPRAGRSAARRGRWRADAGGDRPCARRRLSRARSPASTRPARGSTAAELERCADIARHHIGLAGPSACSCSATRPARALLGQPLAAARGKVAPDRGRAHRRHLPPALAAPAAVGQGAGVEGPVAADERRRLMQLRLPLILLAAPVAAPAARPAGPARADRPRRAGRRARAAARAAVAAARRRSPRRSRATGAACSPRSAPSDWAGAAAGIDALPDGPLKPVARAELFTAKVRRGSSSAPILALLAEAPDLPQAEQLAAPRDRARRDRAAADRRRRARDRPARPRRAAAARARSAASPPPTRCALALEPLVKVDDAARGRGAARRAGADLSLEARAEAAQRVAWIYYVLGHDADARRVADARRAGATGEWAAQAAWVAGLAAWRLSDCAAAAAAFGDVAAARRASSEFVAAAAYWAARADTGRPPPARGPAAAARRGAVERELLRPARARDARHGDTPARAAHASTPAPRRALAQRPPRDRAGRDRRARAGRADAPPPGADRQSPPTMRALIALAARARPCRRAILARPQRPAGRARRRRRPLSRAALAPDARLAGRSGAGLRPRPPGMQLPRRGGQPGRRGRADAGPARHRRRHRPRARRAVSVGRAQATRRPTSNMARASSNDPRASARPAASCPR